MKSHSIDFFVLSLVYSWGGGSRGQLGHGTLMAEEKPRLVQALDGMRIKKIAAGGWHSAVISQYDDLYMFGWNESGQLAQPTNLAKPAECFSAVEKLLMACCTMQPEVRTTLCEFKCGRLRDKTRTKESQTKQIFGLGTYLIRIVKRYLFCIFLSNSNINIKVSTIFG